MVSICFSGVIYAGVGWLVDFRDWKEKLKRGTGSMEGSGAGKGAEVNGSGLPNCCKKAMASVPETEAKLHATVVSGWLSESRPSSG